MHMPLGLQRLSVLCLALVLAVTCPCASGIDIGADVGAGRTNNANRQGVFPLLTWLRDGIIEAIFGPPAADSGRRPGAGAGASPPHALLGPSHADVQRWYHKDVVVRYNVTNADEEEALSRAADQMLLDVWAVTPDYVDIRIDRQSVRSLGTLVPRSLVPTILITDVAELVWGTYPSSRSAQALFHPESGALDPARLRKSAEGVDNVFFRDYQPLSVISSWMRLLEAMFPSYVRMLSIGKSYEGREISALRVGKPPRPDDDNNDEPRKTILITGGLHGREWISTSTVNYLTWSVITAYGKEHVITKLLDTFDIIFVPSLNPDGYAFTWQRDRLWRKSRQTTKMRYCRGIDLDHAFDYEWDAVRRREDPCSESYGGDQPFQAVEASALATWARNMTVQNKAQFVGLLDLHSYSQEILFPYSFSCMVEPPNLENLEELAAGLAKAIRLSSGESYSVMSACEGAVAREYSASDSFPRVESGGGSAIDWFYHELHARYSYQIKLRDTGSYGFLLPSDQIVPTGEEMFNALKYFGDFLLGNNGIEHFPLRKEDADDREADLGMLDLKRRRR